LTCLLTLCLAAAAAAAAPRNIVLFIADGAGFLHFEAARLHEADPTGRQVYDGWPVRLAMSTAPLGVVYDPRQAWRDPDWCDRDATDSAAAITAMTTGVKTANGRLAVDPRGEPVTPLRRVMAAAGKATGVVTTVPFAHATPAGFAVSHPDRGAYSEIAQLMLGDGDLDVVMGAGHPWHDDDGRRCDVADYRWVGGAATWDSLVAGKLGNADAGYWTLITTRAQFQALARGPTPRRVVGVPMARETLQAQRDGDVRAAPFAVPRRADVPTLAEMALAALNVVDEDPDGFCLLIEGGAVDWASHDGRVGRMIEEMMDFNRAVEAVLAGLDERGLLGETLVVVTADHECGHLAGPVPSHVFLTGEHTNLLVPLFARGPGSGELVARAIETDPVRGPYLDNCDLGATLTGTVAPYAGLRSCRTDGPAGSNTNTGKSD
jgi:alkaline phosphatase